MKETSLKSSIEGIAWPAIPDPYAARLLAILDQLDQSQWWQFIRVQEYQLGQLQSLFSHAVQTIPFYRQRLSAAGYVADQQLTWDIFFRVPIMKKSDIQESGDQLLTTKLPASHGDLVDLKTSGSTGQPILVKGTGVTTLFWNALTLRDHLWHQRDLNGKLASIRIKPGGLTNLTSEGAVVPDWGFPVNALFRSGPAVILDIQTSIKDQAQWLIKHSPNFLLSHPTNIKALAEHFLENNLHLSSLKEIRSFGETVDSDLRKLCQNAWRVPLVDVYSAHEVGYIAIQCPEHEHYHVQSEIVIVEILDNNDKPCEPGEVGRVIVTVLHNFAMPLIRYDIGDYAEVGEPCSCGRRLSVLKRIVGRTRNMLTMPDGDRQWPRFPAKFWSEIAPIRQIQLVQRELDWIEACIVSKRTLTTEEEQKCKDIMTERFGYPFKITFSYLAEIPRTPNSKYEDFVSMLPISKGNHSKQLNTR